MNINGKTKLILHFAVFVIVTAIISFVFITNKYPPIYLFIKQRKGIFILEFLLLISLLIVLSVISAFIINKDVSTSIKHITEDAKNLFNRKFLISNQYKENSEFHNLANILTDKNLEAMHYVRDLEENKRSLEKEVYKKNLDLKIALEKEEKATSTKNDFLSNISHELRTPMNGIVGTIALLEDTELDKRQEEYIEAINVSIKSLLKIIKDSLDLSKIESGTINIENIPFSLKQLVEEIINNQLFVKSPNVKFKLNWESDNSEYVVGDPWVLDQVINNILNNAFKFTQEGEVKLTVKNIGSKEDKIGYAISIEDTGIGVDAKDQDNIFKKFSQIDNTTYRETDGPGLGLAIAANLAKALNFKIHVESSLNEGSKFWFTVFLTKADERMVEALKTKEEAHLEIGVNLEGKLALIAEDNKINAMVIEDLLEKYDLKVTVAYNGQEALDEFSKKKFDVIFMDCRMPKMDGYEATRAIRQLEREQELFETPIIALTANALKEDKQKCFDVGMNYYIEKPINKKTLAQTLERCFEELAS